MDDADTPAVLSGLDDHQHRSPRRAYRNSRAVVAVVSGSQVAAE
jgi:hypothetical protein